MLEVVVASIIFLIMLGPERLPKRTITQIGNAYRLVVRPQSGDSLQVQEQNQSHIELTCRLAVEFPSRARENRVVELLQDPAPAIVFATLGSIGGTSALRALEEYQATSALPSANLQAQEAALAIRARATGSISLAEARGTLSVPQSHIRM